MRKRGRVLRACEEHSQPELHGIINDPDSLLKLTLYAQSRCQPEVTGEEQDLTSSRKGTSDVLDAHSGLLRPHVPNTCFELTAVLAFLQAVQCNVQKSYKHRQQASQEHFEQSAQLRAYIYLSTLTASWLPGQRADTCPPTLPDTQR